MTKGRFTIAQLKARTDALRAERERLAPLEGRVRAMRAEHHANGPTTGTEACYRAAVNDLRVAMGLAPLRPTDQLP